MMVQIPAWGVLLALSSIVNADGLYTKNSPVLQVSGKTYDSLIAQSNHTSIVEFYAPWCGHCKNLQPAYEKAAKNLAGLAKVAAVNCDDEANKQFCGQMGVQGFPTLKIVKPGTKPGRPSVEDYQGPRTAKGIVDAVVDKIPNHVKRLKDNDLASFLADDKTNAKALLFSDKGTTAALIKSLAVDFLGTINFGQIRETQKESVKKYGVSQFPTIVLLPGNGAEPVLYSDEMKREPLLDFFSQVASPNPDPAVKKAKSAKSTKTSKDSKSSSTASSAFSKASESHKSEDYADFLNDAGTVILDDDTPTESPMPIVPPTQTPIVVEEVKPIPTLATPEEVKAACLTPNNGNCILVLLPAISDLDATPDDHTQQVLSQLAEVADKHKKRGAKVFPFYAVPGDNAAAKTLRADLGLIDETSLEVLATNMKRGWWSSYPIERNNIEDFVDSIKFGDIKKEKLPDGFVLEQDSAQGTPPIPEPEAVPEPVVEDVERSTNDGESATPEPEASPAVPHSEADAELEAKVDKAFSSIESVASPAPEAEASSAAEHDEL